MTRRVAIAAATAAIVIAVGTSAPAQTLAGLAALHDGDTLYLENATIRLAGIDAPELSQHCADGSGGVWPCGDAAFRLLASIADRQPMICVASGKNRYDRWLARCTVDGADVGAAVVTQGLAWVYRRYSSVYAALENRARARGHGVWRAPTQAP